MQQSDHNNPTVSVITPAFNAEKTIRGTIDSVLAQTYEDYEIIVVDDYSTDRTVEIVEKYATKDSRVRLIQLKENSGAAVARNTAMKAAKGRYLAFLDSDDQWFPTKLEKQLAFMQENDIAFSFTKYVRMDDEEKLTGHTSKAPKSVGYHDLMKHCVIGCLTVMIDREKVGYQEMENIRRRQDYAYWLTLTKQGFKAYGFPEVLAKYRLGHNTVSSNKLKAAKGQWYVYRQIEHQNLLKSSYYFIHYAFKGIKNVLKTKMSKKKARRFSKI